MKQAVLQRSGLDFHVVGQLEAALEGALGDAAIQDTGFRSACFFALLALDGQRVLARFDRKFAFVKTGNGHGDPVGAFAGPLDIVGRIGLATGPAGRGCRAW